MNPTERSRNHLHVSWQDSTHPMGILSFLDAVCKVVGLAHPRRTLACGIIYGRRQFQMSVKPKLVACFALHLQTLATATTHHTASTLCSGNCRLHT